MLTSLDRWRIARTMWRGGHHCQSHQRQCYHYKCHLYQCHHCQCLHHRRHNFHHCFVQVPNGPTDVCRLHRFLCGKTDDHSLESEIFVLLLFWFRIVTIIMFFLRFHFLLGDVFLLQEIKGFRCFPLRFPTQTDVSHLDRCFPLRCEHLNTCVSYSDR